MKQFNNVEKVIGLLMLLFAIGWNLWTYRLEPTARLDPNDNTFQFALVERTNQIWDYATQTCSGSPIPGMKAPPFREWKLLLFPLCHVAFLADHWVPNWAQGYNLPYYYSHVPQIIIVASYHFIRGPFEVLQGAPLQLFTYYHWVIYFLLSLFPLPMFITLRVVGLSWVASGVGAVLATHLSTDGLYGLDPASFLWRGYGLSSQLFAMIFLPLAIAFCWRLFQHSEVFSIKYLVFRRSNTQIPNSKYYIPAVLFLAATTAGHLGIGIMGFMSAAVIAITSVFSSLSHPGNVSDLGHLILNSFKKLILLYGGVFLLLGYWIFPIVAGGNYHNISVWDPIWKFDSYGFHEVLKNLFNGDLFDFGRLPILTALVFIGLFVSLHRSSIVSRIQYPVSSDTHSQIPNTTYYIPFGFLFLFWLLLYFGRTTWGGLIDLIPGMKDFHLSRFIVGVHMAGLFLIPIGFEWIVEKIESSIRYLVSSKIKTKILHTTYYIPTAVVGIILALLLPAIYSQTLKYSRHNDFLIRRANTDFARVSSDVSSLLITLNKLLITHPGRVYVGRGGNWGKDFKVAETQMYLYASTYGIPTILWLPQTWSPNSDTEQYFSDDRLADYALYNVRYVVTPTNIPNGEQVEPRAFWKPLAAGDTWKLYSVDVSDLSTLSDVSNLPSGYITTGVRPAIVSITKENFTNVVHLWIQSDFPTEKLYPELTFSYNNGAMEQYNNAYPTLPHFRMIDEVTYRVPDGSLHNLFAEVPRYLPPTSPSSLSSPTTPTLISQSSENDMIFTATVEVPEGCLECLVILKQTFHPSWRATIDGEPVEPMTVFPFYTAVKVELAGKHEVIFSYQPSGVKKLLLFVSLISLVILLWVSIKDKSLRLRK